MEATKRERLMALVPEDSREELRAINRRWAVMPTLRVAHGVDDAMKDWPLGDFGEDEQGCNIWLATDKVHASEMMLSTADVCSTLAQSGADVRFLYNLIGGLLSRLDDK
jgi:hypothetical protein